MPRSCPFPPFLVFKNAEKKIEKTCRHRLNPLSKKTPKQQTFELGVARQPFLLHFVGSRWTSTSSHKKYAHFVSFLQSGPPGTGIFWDIPHSFTKLLPCHWKCRCIRSNSSMCCDWNSSSLGFENRVFFGRKTRDQGVTEKPLKAIYTSGCFQK